MLIDCIPFVLFHASSYTIPLPRFLFHDPSSMILPPRFPPPWFFWNHEGFDSKPVGGGPVLAVPPPGGGGLRAPILIPSALPNRRVASSTYSNKKQNMFGYTGVLSFFLPSFLPSFLSFLLSFFLSFFLSYFAYTFVILFYNSDPLPQAPPIRARRTAKMCNVHCQGCCKK